MHDLLAPPDVGCSHEDVGRSSVGRHRPDRLDEIVSLLLEEVGAEDDAEPAEVGKHGEIVGQSSWSGLRT